MSSNHSRVSPPLIAFASWVLPGAGYWILGQRARALTIGITILVLFTLGLLIAGVRVLEVPGYDQYGKHVEINIYDQNEHILGTRWILTASPLSEIRNKPWSVPQVLTGPISILAAAWSVHVSGPGRNDPAVLSHARINEIGSLYLSIAGLLNLMAIIDASHRTGQRTAE